MAICPVQAGVCRATEESEYGIFGFKRRERRAGDDGNPVKVPIKEHQKAEEPAPMKVMHSTTFIQQTYQLASQDEEPEEVRAWVDGGGETCAMQLACEGLSACICTQSQGGA